MKSTKKTLGHFVFKGGSNSILQKNLEAVLLWWLMDIVVKLIFSKNLIPICILGTFGGISC